MHRTSEPYRVGLKHLGDVTRDPGLPPKIIQFRHDIRSVVEWLEARLTQRFAPGASRILTLPILSGLRVWEVLLLSTVMQWGMMPMLAADFHRVTLAAPLSNVPAVLLTGLIVPIGFLMLAVSFVWHGLATVLANILSALAALTLIVASYPFAPKLPRGDLEVNVLDVGQGDRIFVAFPDGHTMLIDGGGLPGVAWTGGAHSSFDTGEEIVSPYLWSRGLKRIDVVALTHAHHNHIDGLLSVIQNFRVGELWFGRFEDTPALARLLAEARVRGIRVVQKEKGDSFAMGGVNGKFLWPEDESRTEQVSNDDSLVIHLSDGNVSFLLPGDAQKKSEQQLVGEHADLGADFLKVPHHGSKTSSTEDFLEAVHPKVAVVSAGEGNPFGHPAAETVARYKRDGIRLLRADLDGEVTAITDGANLKVRSFSEESAPR